MVEGSENSTTLDNIANSQHQTAKEDLINIITSPESELIIVHLDNDNYLL